MKKIKLIIVTITILLTMFGLEAKANNTNLKDLERQVQDLSKKIKNIENKSSPSSSSDDSSFTLNGLLHMQYQYEDEKNNNDKHGLQFRRSRLYFGKQISDKVSFKAVLSGNKGNYFEDIAFYYKANENLSFEVGHLALPINLEADLNPSTMAMTDYSDYSFKGLVPDMALGASVRYLFDTVGISLGLFGNSFNDDLGDFSQFITATRAYYAPYKNENIVLHLGANAYYRRLNNTNSTVGSTINVVDNTGNTINTNVKEVMEFGGELLFIANFFSFVGEYRMANYTPTDLTLNKAKFKANNYYVQANAVLTGENYGYENGFMGSYKVARSVSEGGFGGFELTAGYFVEDFKDKNKGFEIPYGKQSKISAGLNWAPENNFRTFFTYSRVENKYSNGLKNSYNDYKLTAKMFF